MRILLAGAFGKLGSDILRALLHAGYDVVAVDMVTRDMPEIRGQFIAKQVDVTDKDALRGICDGIDAVITTVGLTGASDKVTNYDIDYQGNLNLLDEAKAAGVTKFAYISVLKADGNASVPMLHAKAMLEQKLKASGVPYVIFRPTGYFYDIAKVFMPMIENGEVTLLGRKPSHANVIDTTDFADFILEHLCDSGVIYDVGGTETYSYEEIANMFFAAAGKQPRIKRVPAVLFSILALAAKLKKNGKEAIIRFSKWTLTQEMVAEHKVGKLSFREYIMNCYKK